MKSAYPNHPAFDANASIDDIPAWVRQHAIETAHRTQHRQYVYRDRSGWIVHTEGMYWPKMGGAWSFVAIAYPL